MPVVWSPSPAYVERANITRFMRAHGIEGYDELLARSTGDVAWFWDAVVRDLGLDFLEPYDRVLDTSRGVEWATGSVLLHLAYPERYPILDVRALHALGVRAPTSYTFRFWEAYIAACRRLAEEAGVDGRTLDQALWQWSKEQDAPLY